MGNTRDSSGVNPEGKARAIYIWTVSCITHKYWWGWFNWLVPLQAYKLSSCFSLLLFSLFYQIGTLRQASSGSGSLILLVVSQQTSCQSLHAFCTPWPCSILSAWNVQSSKFWQRTSLPVLLALVDYWLWGVWITSQVPLTPGQSQVINWIAHGGIQWVGQGTEKILLGNTDIRLCSNYPICWLSVI